MKNNCFKRILSSIILFLPLSVAGCNSNSLPNVDSLKNALIYLNKGNNYTIVYNQGKLVEHSRIFTSNSIGLVCPTNSYIDTIYYQDSNGVYSIGFNGVEYVGSTYYNDSSKNVWSGDYYPTMKNVATDYINSVSSDKKDLVITDKQYKVGFLRTVGYQSFDYVDMDSLTATFVDKTLMFSMIYKKTEFKYIVKDFGTSKNTILNNFLSKGGSSFSPSKTVLNISSMMKLGNYEQYIFQFGETPETTGYVGKNYFHDQYFYTNYNGSLMASGSIALDGRESASGIYKDIYGCYSFVLDYTEGSQNPISIYPYPTYSEPDMPTYYNYPSLMLIWDHLEFLRGWDARIISTEEYAPVGTSYLISNPTFVNEIQDNFGISSSFSGAVPYAVGVDYISKDTIMLLLKFYINSNAFVMPVPFVNFGNVKNAILDQVIAEMKN